MDTEDASNPQQCRDPSVRLAGLNVLVGRAADSRGKEHGFLGAVLAYPRDPNAVTDSASLFQEPLIVIGQIGHSTNGLPKIIASQPGIPGFL